MRAVVSVIGKDMVGILAKVSNECAKANANVTDVTQSVVKDVFAMIMIIDIENLNCQLSELSDKMEKMGEESNLSIKVMHEDIFNSMHRI